jgi:hypothetical protein
MPSAFVPANFEIPRSFEGVGFRLESLGPDHNDRDYEAWTSSVAHIKETPGFENSDWPASMTLEENLADLVRHARDFNDRRGFTYSIIDDEDVIGCLYIYPSKTAMHDASVRSWVRGSRAEMDMVIWWTVSQWLVGNWPFKNPLYAERKGDPGSADTTG